ncbi:MAG: hypothetical protein IPJ74_13915 [Saprospiraceae bacterium]|nr:hypothetical protein [Saprospiraceae bacterium]
MAAEREGELSQATNFFVFKDSKGFLWVSSINGLNRFDGHTVKVYSSNTPDTLYSMFGNNIQSPFYEDSKENIWFSTYEGINCYIRKHDHFIHDTIMVNGRSVEGYYIAHLDANNNLWLMIQKEGIFQYNIKTKEKKHLHDIFDPALRLKIYADKASGKISRSFVYGQGIAGLQVFDYPDPNNYSKFQTQIFFDGSSKEKLFESMIVFDVLPESDTLVWVSTPNNIIALNPIKKSLQFYNQFPNVTHIEPFKDHYFLLSSLENGLILFDKRTRQVVANYRQQVNNPHSLSSNSLPSVYVDRDGIIWVSVNNKGLDFAHPDNLKFDLLLPPSEDVPWKESRITALAKDQRGNIWCGTNGKGIFSITPEGKLNSILKIENTERTYNTIISILPDNQDRIWIMTWGGILLYNVKSRVFESVTPNNEVFYHATQLQNGQILFGAYRGGVYELVERSDQNPQLKKIESLKSQKPYFPLYQPKMVCYGPVKTLQAL